MRIGFILVALSVVCACAVNHPVAMTPTPDSLGAFLDARHPTDVFVTDMSGRAQIVHDPRLDGDTLRGYRNRELPRARVGIPVGRIRGIAVPQFSVGRTLELAGAVLGVAAIGLLILANSGARPVY